jgi:hypothetical protein
VSGAHQCPPFTAVRLGISQSSIVAPWTYRFAYGGMPIKMIANS